MANALFRKLADGSYLNQGCPGAPGIFRITQQSDNNFYPHFTWNGTDWFQLPGNGFPDVTSAQAALDNYMGKMNQGTA